MWQRIYLHLKNKGIDVYSPGQKTGTCDNQYVVIKDAGQNPVAGTNKLGYSTIDIIIFYPFNKYSEIEDFKKSIKSNMKELMNLRATGMESPILIDEKVKAYTTSIEYQIMKKL